MNRTLPTVGLLACLAFPAQAVDVTYTVAARSDVRARTPLPGDTSTGLTGDLELSPRAEVLLAGDTTTFGLLYAPTLLWREPQTGGRLLPLHRGRLGLGHRFGRASLLLAEDFSYGVADIGSLRAPDGSLPTAVAELTTVGGVPYVRSSSLVMLDSRPSDTFSLDLSGGFNLAGSSDRPDVLPLQWGPTGLVRGRVAVGRQDGLSTTATVVAAQFVTGQQQLITQLRETWDRQLSRTLTLNVGAGAAFTREVVVAPVTLPGTTTMSRAVGIPGTYLELLPVGLVTLGWQDSLAGRPFRLDSSVSLAPFADRFTGFVYERLEARVQAEWRPAKEWVTRATGSGAVAVPLGRSELAGDRLVSGEVLATWNALTWLVLQGSGRVLWTERPQFGQPGTVQAVVTVSVMVQQTDSMAW